jgi:hypothetical protein
MRNAASGAKKRPGSRGVLCRGNPPYLVLDEDDEPLLPVPEDDEDDGELELLLPSPPVRLLPLDPAPLIPELPLPLDPVPLRPELLPPDPVPLLIPELLPDDPAP